MLNIQENVMLAPYTTFKIGGPAKHFAEVKSEEDLKKLEEDRERAEEEARKALKKDRKKKK